MAVSTLVLLPVLKQASVRLPEEKLEEAKSLALAIDCKVVEGIKVPLNDPKPATLFGSGKIEELHGLIAAKEIELAIVDGTLSPIQQRNLEKAWNCKVIDRTALILEIFGARARTSEGKLQVELAALEYQKSRLVRSWTHLERQRGGFGFLGGPGETQIETDRRLIRDQIARIKKQLEKVVRTRELHRKKRRDVPFPLVALVGYTNAGKSTLFNRLTGAKVLAEDKLFATLDPTLRLIKLPSGRKVILSDTVGFISDLPTTLVAAFRATLEEVLEADLLLHVRDISHTDTEAQKQDVLKVLYEIDDSIDWNHSILEGCNKIDRLEPDQKKNLTGCIPVSALTGEGMEPLLNAIDAKLGHEEETYQFLLDPADGKALAWLHANGQVLKQSNLKKGLKVICRLPMAKEAQFRQKFL